MPGFWYEEPSSETDCTSYLAVVLDQVEGLLCGIRGTISGSLERELDRIESHVAKCHGKIETQLIHGLAGCYLACESAGVNLRPDTTPAETDYPPAPDSGGDEAEVLGELRPAPAAPSYQPAEVCVTSADGYTECYAAEGITGAELAEAFGGGAAPGRRGAATAPGLSPALAEADRALADFYGRPPPLAETIASVAAELDEAWGLDDLEVLA